MDKIIIKKSVREFVEFILKDGSLDNRFSNNARAIEGIRAHQKVQKDNEKIYSSYEKEVYLKIEIEGSITDFIIEGRADGIIYKDNEVIVEEIKSTYKALIDIDENYNILHWTQGKVYAYIIAKEKGLNTICVQLSYYNLDTKEVKSFKRKYSYKELQEFIFSLIKEYDKFNKVDFEHRKNRNESIRKIKFPFEEYREGQLNLVKAIYGTIKEGKRIFVQAPTGIGKTISTIFPSIKAVEKGFGDRIFYLTAKGINRTVAEETLETLRHNGLVFRSIVLTAKEKICLNDKISCNPEECIYAKDYYNKQRDVIFEIINNESHISREVIVDYGKRYEVCPFELSLDLILWCDGVICDYNYIFDPRVYLRRVLDEEAEKNILLIDEGHNLVDRARNMYSATLKKQSFLNLKKKSKGKMPKIHNLSRTINSIFIDYRRNLEYENLDYYCDKEFPKELVSFLRKLSVEISEVLTNSREIEFYDELLETFFDINNFLNISELYGEDYEIFIRKEELDISINLFCVNPAEKLRETMDKCGGTAIFSATLIPMEYYINILGGNREDYRLRLKNPFPRENLKIDISPLNIRYKFRDKTMDLVLKEIASFIDCEEGNYFIFSPSYEYMNKLYEKIIKIYGEDRVLLQSRSMSEEDKEEFLRNFSEESNKIGLCVLGGAFSEGVDLPGRRLIGVIIIGVGYPKISIENEIINSYFGELGNSYAYIYPGINKILQAVGRLIRTKEDMGRVLLIDDRYLTNLYLRLLPEEWSLR